MTADTLVIVHTAGGTLDLALTLLTTFALLAGLLAVTGAFTGRSR